VFVQSVADPDHFGKLDPDPHESGKLDPDPHQSEKVEGLEGHFCALEGSNLEKSEWWVNGGSHIRIKLKGSGSGSGSISE
jgi:hypothetical protein